VKYRDEIFLRRHGLTFQQWKLESTDDEKAKLPQKDINKVTLGWLLKQLPDGVTPDQVKVDFGYYASSMAFEDHHIGFYYEVKIPSRMKEYRAAQAKYEEDMKQFLKQQEAYEQYLVQEEIRKTEAKLQALKEGKLCQE
jgi:hypothetical protein